MGEKLVDLTIGDIKAAIALEERNIAVYTAELKFSDAKLRLLRLALVLEEKMQNDKGSVMKE